MKFEYSYGAVVYRIKDGRTEFLIEHMRLGHVSLAKGHIEKGETEEQCALREIKEETNLDVSLNTDFRHTIQYSPKPGILKYVTFFLASATSDKIVSQPEEVSYTEWVSPENAIEKVTFDTDKETLKDAISYMKKHNLL